MNKRTLLKSMLALPLGWSGAHPLLALAQNRSFPTKPITLVLGFGPGNGADTIARLLAQHLSTSMGQQVIVENRPGAGGVASVNQVANAAADGHTLLYIGAGVPISQALFKPQPYDILKTFVPVSTLASNDVIILVRQDSKFNRIEDLIRAAKEKQGGMSVGVSLLGSIQHLTAELLKAQGKADFTIVPFRTATALGTALSAGDIDAAFEFIPPMLPLVKSGHLRVLAIGNAKRSEALPDVPSVAEQGLPKFDVASWGMLVAPALTPDPVVQRLNQEIQRALSNPDVVKRFKELGIRGMGGPTTQARQLLVSELARWANVIETSKISLK